MKVLGIDPGLSGALVLLDDYTMVSCTPMPIRKEGKEKSIFFGGVDLALRSVKREHGKIPIYLERAIPFALGARSAFSYGRGFEALCIAIEIGGFPLHLVEPARWTKMMHAGISTRLKAKEKSLVALRRRYQNAVAVLPRKPSGALYDGPVDALLIAGYGVLYEKGQLIDCDPSMNFL